MKFGILSKEVGSTGWWVRLKEEGHEVKVARTDEHYDYVGDGLYDTLETVDALVDFRPDVIIVDSSGKGREADILRRHGFLVIGGCDFADTLEGKREISQGIAEECGIMVPMTESFSTIEATMDWVKHSGDKTWVFKSDKYLEASATYVSSSPKELLQYLGYIKKRFGNDIQNIVQEKIEGVALSTAAWWNGTTFLKPFLGTIEHKKFMDNDVGPATGCSLNLVWAYQGDPLIAEHLQFDKLAEVFRRAGATPGVYDINAVISKHDRLPYFLEFTPRFGYDSEPTSLRGLRMPLGEFFARLANGTLAEVPLPTDEAWMAVRVSVPPYPTEVVKDEKHSAVGTPILGIDGLYAGHFFAYGVRKGEDQYEVASPFGELGIVATTGTDVQVMGDNILKFIHKMQVPNLQYRSDAVAVISKDLTKLKKLGYYTNRSIEWPSQA